MAAPVESKVQASTAAAAVSGLALYALGRYVFRGSVPDVVASWVYVIVPGVITFAAGYLAKHAHRPAPAPVITVNAVGSPEETARQIDAALRRYARDGLAAARPDPQPEPPAEKTLVTPPAAPE
ncbi:MAG TPA: hypothetical protein VFQ68_44120 [Streptosporangiaceae bacterium]|nr:hypothetical protein [Streptosporangiaceae bacterium]